MGDAARAGACSRSEWACERPDPPFRSKVYDAMFARVRHRSRGVARPRYERATAPDAGGSGMPPAAASASSV